MSKLNSVAIVASVATLLLIAASFFVPWWSLAIGRPQFSTMSFSPVNVNLSLFSSAITTPPLILALNISALLTLLSAALILLIYAVKPDKSYSMKLLSFSYKIPISTFILFVIEIVGLALGVKVFTGIDFPLMGSGTVGFPAQYAPGGISASIQVAGAFEWPFYLAIVVVALCVAARLYHKSAIKNPVNNLPPPPSAANGSLIS